MNITEKCVAQWFPKQRTDGEMSGVKNDWKHMVTEDEIRVMCKQHKQDLIQQSMVDVIENIDYWRSKVEVEFK